MKPSKTHAALFPSAVAVLLSATTSLPLQGITIVADSADRVILDTSSDGLGDFLGTEASTIAHVGEWFTDADQSRYYLPVGPLTPEQLDAILAAPNVPGAITLNVPLGIKSNVSNVSTSGGTVDLSVDIFGYNDASSVTPLVSDYQSTDVTSLFEDGVTTASPNGYLQLDITEFAKQEIAAGNSILAFRFQIAPDSLPNSDQAPNRYTFQTADHDNQPFLEVKPGIHPGVDLIRYWLTYEAPDGLQNGMRKSITYHSPTHQISGSTVTYSGAQSSAMARTAKFLSEYYLTYSDDLNSAEKASLYLHIQDYTTLLLQHRKYQNGWGWELDEEDLIDGNLETNKFYHGGVVTASTWTMFTALGNSFSCEAFLAASKVADLHGDVPNRDRWLDAAQLIGDFLCRLADPYDYYSQTFGAYPMVSNQGNPIQMPGFVYGTVTANETLYTSISLQNLYAIVPLKELSEATGISSYYNAALQIRDRMTIGLANDFNSGYFPDYDDNATGKLVGNEFENNTWDADIHSGAPMVGDDALEYSLAALWKFHDLDSQNYTFTYDSNGVKSFDMKVKAKRFHDAPADKMLNYDPYISFTGFFRKPVSQWLAWMPYYDTVGFGLLGELHQGVFYNEYVTAWDRMVADKVDAGREDDLVFVMLDSDLDLYWTGSDKTAKGTLSSVAIGLSIMAISPYVGGLP